MWQIRTIEEIEAAREDRRKKGWRWIWVDLLTVSWVPVLGDFYLRHQYGPKDFEKLVFMLLLMPLVLVAVAFGRPTVRRRRKPTTGLLCRRCEKIWYDEKQLVCSCGERLFRVDELKWETTEAEKLANGEGSKEG